MRRKNPPTRDRNKRSVIKRNTNQAYIISKKAETILSMVLEDILEESLEDARNLAVTAGKSSVTREEMEKSLRNLCLRLSTVPAYSARIGSWNDDEDESNKGPVDSSKVVSEGSRHRCCTSSRCHGDCSHKIVTIYRNLRFLR
ncbi:uncharacterized protein LOC117232585 [Bombus vosnesenskii]|uniref:Uncharacterized protein LOC117232585 n=2 Tax=Pyrobombus TaxID=144703 RepID=A0A6J3K485_9HYME|nr:uncharacterized protein LOC117156287 [Bombus vancouverensis nearcticus]XP_033314116.1 uncharacterized protein LOC117213012 [Bombus bifarius]XP_033347923.1 uncharacterized protein LOC117232585 [Bombus vosnesenskii]